MPTSRGALRWVALTAVVLALGVAAITWYRGAGPIVGREHCVARVGQQRVDLSPEQARNATLIAAIGVRRGLPARAVSIAFATAYQESKLVNLDHGDRDSLGLFQQRPSQGWGTVAQVRDPYYATNRFYDALARVDGFRTMRITDAAQRVQRSGFPEAYEPHAADARALASALTGYSAGGRFSCVVHTPRDAGRRGAVVARLERAFGPLASTAAGREVQVEVASGQDGTRQGWAVAQYAVAHARGLRVTGVSFDDHRWRSGLASRKGWTPTSTPSGRVTLTLR